MDRPPGRRYPWPLIMVVIAILVVSVAIYATSYAGVNTSPDTTICLCPDTASCPCRSEGGTTTSSAGGGTTTTTSCPSVGDPCATTTTLTTISMANIFVASNSSDNLQFSLMLKSNGGENITVTVRDTNLLGSVNDINDNDGWKINPLELNPYNGCPGSQPVGFEIATGYYSMYNFTSADPLPLYDTDNAYSCSTTEYSIGMDYAFQPMSDVAVVYAGTQLQYHVPVSLNFSTTGYWTGGIYGNGGAAKFNTFAPGTYTVIGADQWGGILLLHFTVSIVSISTTSSCSGYPPGGDCISTYDYAFTVSVNYTGPWKLTYQGYNNLGKSNLTNMSGSYAGSGFFSKDITLSGVTTGGLTLCAQAEKLDSSNAKLVLTVTGSNETSLPYGTVSYCGSVVP